MLTHSETIDKLAAALHKAQGLLQGAVKDKVNPHLKNRYADLASCWDACRDALQASGLALTQWPIDTEAGVGVETMLVHTSGQWMRCAFVLPMPKRDPQGGGSAITYCRRYSLCAVLGICPEDDDGSAASQPPRQEARPANGAPAEQPVKLGKKPQTPPDSPAVAKWKEFIDRRVSLAEFNKNLHEMSELEPDEKKAVWALVQAHGSSRGWRWDDEAKAFRMPPAPVKGGAA